MKQETVCQNPQCNKVFLAERKDLNRGRGKYCSKACAGKATHPKLEPNGECGWCQKPIRVRESQRAKSKSGLVFCCREHKDLAQRLDGLDEVRPRHYGTSVDYRQHFKRHRVIDKCERCGYDEVPEVLQVHHKDRDKTNADMNNLELLCPTCHSVEHFKAGDGAWVGNSVR